MSAPSQVPSTLHLLLGPSATPARGDRASVDARSPLARMLGRGEARARAAGLARDHAAALAGFDAPVAWASLWAQAHAVASPAPGTPLARWLWLEPVRMQVGMNHVAMAPPALVPDARMLTALCAQLQPLFADAGASLEVAGGRLLLALGTALEVHCTPPEQAFDSALREQLPAGRDAGMLRRWMTECEMQLHQAGEDPVWGASGINAVWPWGSGALPKLKAPSLRVFSSDPLLQALDRLATAGTAHASSSDAPGSTSLEALLAADTPLPASLVHHGSVDDAGLAGLLAAADQALRRGRLARLEIDCWPPQGASPAVTAVSVRRSARWRWWRRPALPWTLPDA
ncbi:MAG: hypothetical protein KGI67_08170 [Pseudomonadota bacterium]|nr:hypothetical protein [Pseudomonadota bacterium]